MKITKQSLVVSRQSSGSRVASREPRAESRQPFASFESKLGLGIQRKPAARWTAADWRALDRALLAAECPMPDAVATRAA